LEENNYYWKITVSWALNDFCLFALLKLTILGCISFETTGGDRSTTSPGTLINGLFVFLCLHAFAYSALSSNGRSRHGTRNS
jgi:hypothetical protein